MPFHKVEPEKLSASVVRQIELLILRGILRPGERLPAERDLAERLGVSRPSLRDAIAELSEAGLLSAKAGAGIYVADVLGSAFSPALIGLFQRNEEALFDSIAFRRDMEGLAAERAARAASDLDLAVIAEIFAKMESAGQKRDPSDEAELDVRFHMAIIEASHNVVLLHMMRSIYELLKQGVFYNRKMIFKSRDTREQLLDQHRAIHQALQARAPQAARQAVESHLDYVAEALRAQLQAERNETIAKQRYAHELER